MIELKDIIVIAAGYALGFAAGFFYGLNSGRIKFWKMPSASWKVRKK